MMFPSPILEAPWVLLRAFHGSDFSLSQAAQGAAHTEKLLIPGPLDIRDASWFASDRSSPSFSMPFADLFPLRATRMHFPGLWPHSPLSLGNKSYVLASLSPLFLDSQTCIPYSVSLYTPAQAPTGISNQTRHHHRLRAPPTEITVTILTATHLSRFCHPGSKAWSHLFVHSTITYMCVFYLLYPFQPIITKILVHIIPPQNAIFLSLHLPQS